MSKNKLKTGRKFESVPDHWNLSRLPKAILRMGRGSLHSILTGVVLFLTTITMQHAAAEIVVTVDISNPAAVTFQTTTSDAEAAFVDTAFNGITLRNFFSGNTTSSTETIPGGIEIFSSPTAMTTTVLNITFVNNFPGGYTTNDFTFYGSGGEEIYSFSNQRAIGGCAVFDSTQFTGLPANGATGDIYIGEPDSGQIIGQWQVADAATLITMTGDNNPSYNGPLNPWNAQTLLEIGINSSGTAVLDGSEIQSVGGSVGSNSNAVGLATITGPGSHWNMSGDLNIGLFGNGTVNLEQCGRLSAVEAFLGGEMGSMGTVNVTGGSAQWSNTGNLYIGDVGTGQMDVTDGGQVSSALRTYVGFDGTGTLNVTDSSFTSGQQFILGENVTGVGTATIDASSLTIANNFHDLIVGRNGLGQMFVQNDSSVVVKDSVLIGQTALSTGDNRLEVTGGSTVFVEGFDTGVMRVGSSGNGTFILDDGSTLNGPIMSAGSFAGSTGNVIIDGGGTLANLTAVSAANDGIGNVTVSGGAQLNVSATLTVGDSGIGVGTVTITGADELGNPSTVSVNDRAEIGGSNNETGGTGTVNIEAGGILTTGTGLIGLKSDTVAGPGGFGTVNVSDEGSSWQPSSIVVGGNGEGHLNITAGGHVSTINNIRVGDDNNPGEDGPASILVSGSVMGDNGLVPSTLDVGSELSVGDDRAATMTIADGGVVNSGLNGSSEGIIGDFPPADGVVVTVDNGTWNHLGSRIKVGADGGSSTEPSTLNVINGGKVNSSGLFMIADDTFGSHGLAEIIGAGSEVTATDSVVGDAGTGTLNVLDGGSLSLSGDFDVSGVGTGTVLVSGQGSSIDVFIDVVVGRSDGSVGELTIENGGTLTVESGLRVAELAGSTGTVNVASGGNLIVQDEIVLSTDIQGEGTGVLNISGGDVFNDEFEQDLELVILQGGTVNLMDGSLNVELLHVDGEFNFTGGTLIANFINSSDGQFFQAGGTLAPATSFGQTGATSISFDYFLLSTGSIDFDIEGAAVIVEDYDHITVGGNAILEGTMKVNLSGYQPVAGDMFQLFEVDGNTLGSPTFDFSNATLNNGLQWDTSNFLTDGTISVSGDAIMLGDVNCDGVVNLLDVQPFVTLISTGGFLDKADINQDGVVNLLDVEPFVGLLSGG